MRGSLRRMMSSKDTLIGYSRKDMMMAYDKMLRSTKFVISSSKKVFEA